MTKNGTETTAQIVTDSAPVEPSMENEAPRVKRTYTKREKVFASFDLRTRWEWMLLLASLEELAKNQTLQIHRESFEEFRSRVIALGETEPDLSQPNS